MTNPKESESDHDIIPPWWKKRFRDFLHTGFDGHVKRDTETHRWLFCWNGEDALGFPFDCACCIDGKEREAGLDGGCGCICHERITQMEGCIGKIVAEARRRALDEAIALTEQALSSGHGGGNWRRLYTQLIDKLEKMKI